MALLLTTGCDPEARVDAIFDRDGDGWDDIERGGDDCDDEDPQIHPAQEDACDGVDNDCDGETDEDAPDLTGWQDGDGDGWGAAPWSSCFDAAGRVERDGDCDDGDAAVSPDADEVCNNGIDDDCDGSPGACAWSGHTSVDTLAAGRWTFLAPPTDVALLFDSAAYAPRLIVAWSDALRAFDTGATTPQDESSATLLLSAQGWQLAAGADLTGDHIDDVVVATTSPSRLCVLPGGDLTAWTSAWQDCAALPEGVVVDQLVTGDVDGDGLADVTAVSSGPDGRRLSVWRGPLQDLDPSAPDATSDLEGAEVTLGAGAPTEVLDHASRVASHLTWPRSATLTASTTLQQADLWSESVHWGAGGLDGDGDGRADALVVTNTVAPPYRGTVYLLNADTGVNPMNATLLPKVSWGPEEPKWLDAALATPDPAAAPALVALQRTAGDLSLQVFPPGFGSAGPQSTLDIPAAGTTGGSLVGVHHAGERAGDLLLWVERGPRTDLHWLAPLAP